MSRPKAKKPTPREGLNKVNSLLSQAQQVIGMFVADAETKESHREEYEIGSTVFEEIEELRWWMRNAIQKVKR